MSRFIISGGGTGGHVYPAIAIAQRIKLNDPDADILFIGALGKLEMDKVPAAGFRIEGLPVAGFIRRVTWKNLTFPFKLMKSLRRAKKMIASFKPDVVIGVGGYASGPTLRVATSAGIPSLIQEQNSFPGVTNRLLGERVNRICVAYTGMDRYFPKDKIVLTGNPVRSDLVDLKDHLPEAYTHFGLNPAKKTLLVMGGSGGAKTINNSILTLLEQGLPEDVQLLWQTGKYYYEEVQGKLADAGYGIRDAGYEIRDTGYRIRDAGYRIRDNRSPIANLGSRITSFIDRMDLAYSCADLVVSRAGAIAISELCLVGKPVILIPSPNVAEDHQTKNAMALVHQEAAVMIHDNEASKVLPDMVKKLMADNELRDNLGRRIRLLAIPDAAEQIAEEVFLLVKPKGGRYE
ncbi:MAG: UDP-N-acetylglucosamine--N-acetylmuramyl-(pentapeptide) pyrophosphoryl-undecaprenol N-acetylglucosamine transferase [Bacteroidales bacterium]|nr:UDP-N-acetylglucosamine--N-acetylmuramyl-(pentapeptide) pyrophosphoryl-undecaprenol N-acetylglucosamine transferase [Bacteroidales bacterium]